MRHWVRWLQPTEDYRPLSDPPNEAILGWWCSGYRVGGEAECAILCALVEAPNEDAVQAAVVADWPEADFESGDSFVHERAPDWLPGDRFPLKDWALERVSKATKGRR